jgi:predicted O-methyltransferase YrrM
VEIPVLGARDLHRLTVEVEEVLSPDAGWCSLEKANSLVAIIVALRPRVVVELGVWMGGSAIPMALALKAVGSGQLVAIDAWSAEMSVAGQELEIHRKWWETVGERGHSHAFEVFLSRLRKHGIRPGRCTVRRQRTNEAVVPPLIDLLHHDANHGPQVVDDIERWTPAIRVGGMLVLDDLDWAGGHVLRARDRALELGFVELYPLGTGCVMQRVRAAGIRGLHGNDLGSRGNLNRATR